MQMQMEHGLAGVRSDVVYRPIAALFQVVLTSEFGGNKVAVANYLGVFRCRCVYARKVFLRNDQDVRRRTGLDVVKCEDFIVFVCFLGGNLAANNFAEQAVSHSKTFHHEGPQSNTKVDSINSSVNPSSVFSFSRRHPLS